MRSEGYGTWFVCVFLCLSVYGYSGTTGYRAAYGRYQQLQNNKMAIFPKRLRSKDMAWKQAKKPIHAANNVYTIRWTYLLALH